MTPCQSECYFKHWFELWPEPESPWPDVDPLPPIQLDPPVDFELPFPDYDGVIPIDIDLNPPSQFPYPDMIGRLTFLLTRIIQMVAVGLKSCRVPMERLFSGLYARFKVNRHVIAGLLVVTMVAMPMGCSGGHHTGIASEAPTIQPDPDEVVQSTGSLKELDVVDGVHLYAPNHEELSIALQRDPSIVISNPATERAGVVVAAVRESIGRYPPSFVSSYAPKVYIVDTLEVNGVPMGGTYRGKSIFLAASGRSGKTKSKDVVMFAFHHELSSLLMNNNPTKFSIEKWQAINPPGFRYLKGGGEAAVRSGRLTMTGNAALYEGGFLVDYSQASVEEDFNCIAAAVMMPLPNFDTLAERYDRIRQKAQFVVEFYSAIDSSLAHQMKQLPIFEAIGADPR